MMNSRYLRRVQSGTDEVARGVILWRMAKRRAEKTSKRKAPNNKTSKTSKTNSSTAASRKKSAAARAKAAAKREAAEQAAAKTIHYAPPPEQTIADPSKAPGHQHRRPPMNIAGVKHSEAYIAKARTPFNRRQNIGR
jgi:hypothetical protein